MALERTFSILKPDATARNLTGAINAMIEQAGLRIVAQKRVRISLPQARKFYAVHRERPFFGELVDFMVSGPVVVQVLEGDNAIGSTANMGATRPGAGRPQGARQVDRREFRARPAPDTAGRRSRSRRTKSARSRAGGTGAFTRADAGSGRMVRQVSSGWSDGPTEFWVALVKIMWINVLLSGDNALVIRQGLPPGAVVGHDPGRRCRGVAAHYFYGVVALCCVP